MKKRKKQKSNNTLEKELLFMLYMIVSIVSVFFIGCLIKIFLF